MSDWRYNDFSFILELSAFLYHICFYDQRQIIKKYMNKGSEFCIPEFENVFPGHII